MDKKKAFTVVELIVVLVLIGVILSFEVQVIRHKVNQYGAAYYSTYNSLRKLAYNIIADTDCPDCEGPTSEETPGDPNTRLICNATGEVSICPNGPRNYPRDHVEMCKRLIDYFNLAGDPTCDSDPIVLSSTDTDVFRDETVGGKKGTLKFMTSNSLKYYLSDYMEHTIGGDKIGFFIVYVDLNGDKRPNTIEHKGGETFPDIVPFVITQRGEVVPAGFPIYSRNYLTAKVKFPAHEDASGNPVESMSESMTFYEAVNMAWVQKTGTPSIKESLDITFSWDVNKHFAGLPILTTKLTQKDGKKTKIVDFPGDDFFSASQEAAKNRGRVNGCEGGTYNCKVIIDSNSNTRF